MEPLGARRDELIADLATTDRVEVERLAQLRSELEQIEDEIADCAANATNAVGGGAGANVAEPSSDNPSTWKREWLQQKKRAELRALAGQHKVIIDAEEDGNIDIINKLMKFKETGGEFVRTRESIIQDIVQTQGNYLDVGRKLIADVISETYQGGAELSSHLLEAMDKFAAGYSAGARSRKGMATRRAIEKGARLLKQPPHLMVIGDISAGKSTLLNLLIGHHLLPRGDGVVTLLIVEIRHCTGDRPNVSCRAPDGTTLVAMTPPATPDEATWAISVRAAVAKAMKEATNPASVIVIEWPFSPLLATGIVLVDTPGLNDQDPRAEALHHYAPAAVAALVLVDSSAGQDLTESLATTIRVICEPCIAANGEPTGVIDEERGFLSTDGVFVVHTKRDKLLAKLESQPDIANIVNAQSRDQRVRDRVTETSDALKDSMRDIMGGTGASSRAWPRENYALVNMQAVESGAEHAADDHNAFAKAMGFLRGCFGLRLRAAVQQCIPPCRYILEQAALVKGTKAQSEAETQALIERITETMTLFGNLRTGIETTLATTHANATAMARRKAELMLNHAWADDGPIASKVRKLVLPPEQVGTTDRVTRYQDAVVAEVAKAINEELLAECKQAVEDIYAAYEAATLQEFVQANRLLQTTSLHVSKALGTVTKKKIDTTLGVVPVSVKERTWLYNVTVAPVLSGVRIVYLPYHLFKHAFRGFPKTADSMGAAWRAVDWTVDQIRGDWAGYMKAVLESVRKSVTGNLKPYIDPIVQNLTDLAPKMKSEFLASLDAEFDQHKALADSMANRTNLIAERAALEQSIAIADRSYDELVGRPWIALHRALIAPSDVRKGDRLSGNNIYRGELRVGGNTRQVAIKVMVVGPNDGIAGLRQLGEEITLATTLQHTNMATSRGVVVHPPDANGLRDVWLVSDLARETLQDVLDQVGANGLSQAEAVVILSDIAAALEHLHSLGMMHRDVNPSNILMFGKATAGRPYGVAKLGDYGAARDATVIRRTVVRTPGWEAPEMISGEGHTTSLDVYGLGLLAWRLVAQRTTAAADLILRQRGRMSPLGANPREGLNMLDDAYVQLMTACLHEKPDGRPAAFTLMQECGTLIENAIRLAAGLTVERPVPAVRRRGMRILAMDGGGTRAIIVAAFLARLEAATGVPILSSFDLICGTSGGGLIGTALTTPTPDNLPGMHAAACVQLCLDMAAKVFPPRLTHPIATVKSIAGNTALFDNEPLRQLVGARFGSHRLRDGGVTVDGKVTPFVFVTTRKDKLEGAYLLRNYAHVGSEPHHGATGWPVSLACLATSAAPVFLPALTFNGSTYTDGGVGFNNCGEEALIEGQRLLLRRPDLDGIDLILSIGTGYDPASTDPNQPVAMGLMGNPGRIFSHLQDNLTPHLIAHHRLKNYCSPDGVMPKTRYVRLDVPITNPAHNSLTVSDAAVLNSMAAAAEVLVAPGGDLRTDFEDVVRLCKTPGPNGA